MFNKADKCNELLGHTISYYTHKASGIRILQKKRAFKKTKSTNDLLFIMMHQNDHGTSVWFDRYISFSMVPADFYSSAGVYEYIFVDCNRYDIDDIDSKETKKK